MNVVVFFTFGLSLKKWREGGMLSREIALYKELEKKGNTVTLITYGNDEDFDYRKELGTIRVVPVYAAADIPDSGIYRFLHSLILPFKLKPVLKNADILKTNQMWGSWAAVISKLLYRKKLVVRCGYEQFRFALMMRMPLSFKAFTFLNSLISYHLADTVVVSSEIGKDFIRRCFKVPADKITVIYNYVDTELFKSQTTAQYPDRVFFVGRLEREKTFSTCLTRFVKLPTHWILPAKAV